MLLRETEEKVKRTRTGWKTEGWVQVQKGRQK